MLQVVWAWESKFWRREDKLIGSAPETAHLGSSKCHIWLPKWMPQRSRHGRWVLSELLLLVERCACQLCEACSLCLQRASKPFLPVTTALHGCTCVRARVRASVCACGGSRWLRVLNTLQKERWVSAFNYFWLRCFFPWYLMIWWVCSLQWCRPILVHFLLV